MIRILPGKYSRDDYIAMSTILTTGLNTLCPPDDCVGKDCSNCKFSKVCKNTISAIAFCLSHTMEHI